MSGKIYTLLPALPLETVAPFAVVIAAMALCGCLIAAVFMPMPGKEG